MSAQVERCMCYRGDSELNSAEFAWKDKRYYTQPKILAHPIDSERTSLPHPLSKLKSSHSTSTVGHFVRSLA
jgi:hypothetical protein